MYVQLIRASNFWLLELVTLVEQMEDGHYLLVFEGVLFRRKLELLIVTDVAHLLLWWSFTR